MEKRYGFGIVGAGIIAHIHAQAIRAIPGAELKGVYSTGAAKSAAFAETHGCKAHPALESLLADPGIDIICICTPSGSHLEPALAAIGAGKHCLVEKPLEITPDRCDLIIAAARSARVQLGVVFPSRFYEESKRLKQAIDDGGFGTLCLGSAYVKWSRTHEYYQSGKWRGTWQFDGGGALMNQGIHSVDLLQWYMGPVQKVQAFATRTLHKEIEAEDTLVAIIHFANGALGALECSTAVFPGSPRRIEILGTGGTAVLEETAFVKWQFREPVPGPAVDDGVATLGGAANPADIGYWAHQRQIADFIDAVEKNRLPLVDGTEGRKAVEIVTAMYESARTGNPVELHGKTNL